jgi:hypothetical protein
MYKLDRTIFGKTYSFLEVGINMQRAYQAQNSSLAIMQLQLGLELLGFVLRKARFAG